MFLFNFIVALSLNQYENNITLKKCTKVESLDRASSSTLICYSEQQHFYQQDVCVIVCANGSLWEASIFETDFFGKIPAMQPYFTVIIITSPLLACNQRSQTMNFIETNCTCGKLSISK